MRRLIDHAARAARAAKRLVAGALSKAANVARKRRTRREQRAAAYLAAHPRRAGGELRHRRTWARCPLCVGPCSKPPVPSHSPRGRSPRGEARWLRRWAWLHGQEVRINRKAFARFVMRVPT